MIHLLWSLTSFFKFKGSGYCIDNWVFQLHYRYTTGLLFLASIFVTLRHYFGEHIQCIADLHGFNKVVDTFCFFTSTFTVIKDYNNKYAAHPGVGAYGIGSKEPIRRHYYYQWVPFVLFLQAIMFHLTHLLWKKYENGRIRLLIEGLDRAAFSYKEETQDESINNEIRSARDKKQECMQRIRSAFVANIMCDKSWSRWLIFCEILNVLNLVSQVYFTHIFLGKQFYSLGTNLIYKGSNVLNEVFPKMTKCTFHKYGPSGSIQFHDALCVMALNIIIEKIYVILWFWFAVLFALSCGALTWRIITIYLHSNSVKFNQALFASNYLGKINRWDIELIMRHFSFTQWIFLKYLAKNLDPVIFRELFSGLIEDLEEEGKPLFAKLKGRDWSANLGKTRKYQ